MASWDKYLDNKSFRWGAVFMVVVVFGLAGALTTMGSTKESRSRAETCNYRDNPSHPCNGHDPGWSTCDSSGRWGCDGACNQVDLPDDWCEGTTRKHCSGGNITETPNSCECGGTGCGCKSNGEGCSSSSQCCSGLCRDGTCQSGGTGCESRETKVTVCGTAYCVADGCGCDSGYARCNDASANESWCGSGRQYCYRLGSVSGTVRDWAGNPVPNANVAVIVTGPRCGNDQGNARTDGNGHYTVSNMNCCGDTRIVANKDGCGESTETRSGGWNDSGLTVDISIPCGVTPTPETPTGTPQPTVTPTPTTTLTPTPTPPQFACNGLTINGLNDREIRLSFPQALQLQGSVTHYGRLYSAKVPAVGGRVADPAATDVRTLATGNGSLAATFTPPAAGVYVFETNAFESDSCNFLCSPAQNLYRNDNPAARCDSVTWTRTGGCTSSNCIKWVTFETLTPTPTPTIPFTMDCVYCRIYVDGAAGSPWQQVTDFSTLRPGQTVHLTTEGTTTDPGGITKARFRVTVNGTVGSWAETNSVYGPRMFYLNYTLPVAGTYIVESMVYNPNLGWR